MKNRCCPVCGSKIGVLYFIACAIKSKQGLKCPNCKAYITKPLSKYNYFAILGFGAILILSNTNLYQYIVSTTHIEVIYVKILIISLLVSVFSLCLYYLIPYLSSEESKSIESENVKRIEDNKNISCDNILEKYSGFIYVITIIVCFSITAISVLMFKKYVGYIVMLASMPFLLIPLYKLLLSARVKNWNSAPAELIDSVVCSRKALGADDSVYTEYYPKVLYGYSVNGKKYIGSNISIDLSNILYREYEDAKNFVDGLIGKDKLTVLYQRQNPKHSLIIGGLSRKRIQHYITVMVGGVAIFVFGLFFR